MKSVPLGITTPRLKSGPLGITNPRLYLHLQVAMLGSTFGGCHEDEGRVGRIICLRRLLIGQQGCPLVYLLQGRREVRILGSEQLRVVVR